MPAIREVTFTRELFVFCRSPAASARAAHHPGLTGYPLPPHSRRHQSSSNTRILYANSCRLTGLLYYAKRKNRNTYMTASVKASTL